MVLKTLKFNILFKAEYINTKLNVIVDCISRCQCLRFWALVPRAKQLFQKFDRFDSRKQMSRNSNNEYQCCFTWKNIVFSSFKYFGKKIYEPKILLNVSSVIDFRFRRSRKRKKWILKDKTPCWLIKLKILFINLNIKF